MHESWCQRKNHTIEKLDGHVTFVSSERGRFKRGQILGGSFTKQIQFNCLKGAQNSWKFATKIAHAICKYKHTDIHMYVWMYIYICLCLWNLGIFFGTDHRLARDLYSYWPAKSNNGQTCCWKRYVWEFASHDDEALFCAKGHVKEKQLSRNSSYVCL